MSLARCGGRVSSYTVITNTVMAVVTSVEQQIAEVREGGLEHGSRYLNSEPDFGIELHLD